MDELSELQNLRFVKNMGKLSLLSFLDVYDTNDEFVQFTREGMSEGKGVFGDWLRYVKFRDKIKQNNGGPTDNRSDGPSSETHQ